MNMFYGGQVGVICSGSYALAEVKDRAPNLNYGLFLFPHPAGKGGPSSFIGGDLIGIPKDSKHPDEAWDFIQYALSSAIQVDVWAKDGMPPVRESLTKNKLRRRTALLRVL
jgi:multiple sugar transport system substrate-binding protein